MIACSVIDSEISGFSDEWEEKRMRAGRALSLGGRRSSAGGHLQAESALMLLRRRLPGGRRQYPGPAMSRPMQPRSLPHCMARLTCGGITRVCNRHGDPATVWTSLIASYLLNAVLRAMKPACLAEARKRVG